MTDFEKLTEINNKIAELEADRDGLNAIWFVIEYTRQFMITTIQKKWIRLNISKGTLPKSN